MPISTLTSLRILQIRVFARFLTLLGQTPGGTRRIALCRNSALLSPALRFLLGYQRSFPTYADAKACGARYISSGHEHADNLRVHAEFANIIRESDYPPLYFLTPIAASLRSVFDLGGSVGNLFYAYDQELHFPQSLRWTVYDLPEQIQKGRELAAERHESRLQFTNSMADASGVDLFITSGSLHYFETPLFEMLRSLPALPARVLVNRAPFSKGSDLFTIQDNWTYMVPCKLHSKEQLVVGMHEIGYTLRAEWPVYERKLWVPDYPDLSWYHGFGFYFERD